MPDNMPIPLYLFAKAPIPGCVKTRMRPNLTDSQCAELAEMMLCQSVEQVVRYWPGEVILCVAPNADHPSFINHVSRLGIRIEVQINASLGDRMATVLEAGLESANAAVVMGCDVPYIAGNVLEQAHNILMAGNNAIGPAEDGGFYLLGARHFNREVFRNIGWGGNAVLHKVIQQGNDNQIAFSELPIMRDIDRFEDLQWLASIEPQYRRFITTR